MSQLSEKLSSSTPSSLSTSSTPDSSSDMDGINAWAKDVRRNIGKPNLKTLELRKLQDDHAAWMEMQASSSIAPPRRRRRHVDRGREEGAKRFLKDYFDENPTFHGDYFRRRYRMRVSLFEKIASKIVAHDPYFTQRAQCTGQAGFHPYIKIAAALKMMAYGVAADACDEYLRIAETTTLKCLRHFTKAVVDLFSVEFLREPNSDDIDRLLKENAERGFPGMIGSVDCMHWTWKNCPNAWRGTYQNYKGQKTIVLEAVASKDGWIWHAFFGMPGSLNDVNVMNVSGIFDRCLKGEMPSVPYVVNGNEYTTHYLLGDGIYPKYSTIQKTIRDPRTLIEKRFASFHESVRKDVERAFGVLQGRWGIIRRPAESWNKDVLHNIMLACIILHNMINQDEHDIPPCQYETMKKDKEKRDEKKKEKKKEDKRKSMHGRYAEIVAAYAKLQDGVFHDELKTDLMEHIWRESARGNIRL